MFDLHPGWETEFVLNELFFCLEIAAGLQCSMMTTEQTILTVTMKIFSLINKDILKMQRV